MVCAGCGRELNDGEDVVEVAREWVYCLEYCAIRFQYHAA